MRRTAGNLLDRSEAEDVMRRLVDATRASHPHPNPRVAAAIVTPDGTVRAIGVHERPGMPHAERLVLGQDASPDDTLLVTLEPCHHHGRTPPCTDAIIASGIRRVIVGTTDPDPRVSGMGIEALRDAGIEVQVGVVADLVESNDAAYFHQRRTGRSRFTLKLATTLDGQAGAVDGTSQWITGPDARRDAHVLRSEHDAVMVGSGTAIADNPSLNVRLEGYDGPQPRRIVIAGRRELPGHLDLATRDTIVVRNAGGVDLEALATELPDRGILGVLVEGGPTLAASMLRARLIDEIVWYFGPLIAGGAGLGAIAGVFETLTDATAVVIRSVQTVGSDIKVVAVPSSARGDA